MDLPGQPVAQLRREAGDTGELGPHASLRPEGAQYGGAAGGETMLECVLGPQHARGAQAIAEQVDIGAFPRRWRGTHHARDQGAAQTGGFLQPFQITAQPIEIIRDPAGQIARGAADRHGARVQHGHETGGGGFVRHDPDILGNGIVRQTAGDGVFLGQSAGQTARQGPPGGAVMGQEHPQRDRPRVHALWSDTGRHRGQGRHQRRVLRRMRRDPPGQRGALAGWHVRREKRHRGAIGGMADDPSVQIAQHGAQIGALAQPEGGLAGGDQILAQKLAGEAGEESGQSGRLGQSGAGMVHHMHRAGAHRVQQAGRAGAARQFQRVHPRAFQPAHQHTDPFQPPQGLQEHEAAADRQIARLDQADREFAGEQDMLEPERVGVPRGQQRDPALAARRQRPQCLPAAFQEGAQRFDELIAKDFRDDAREVAAVLQHIPQTARLVGAVRQHAPYPVGAAHQVGGVDVQVFHRRPVGARDAAGPQERRIAIDEFGRNRARAQQCPRPMDVGQNRLDQPRPLRQPRLQPREFLGRQDQGDGVAAPVDRLLAGQHGGDAFLDEGAFQQLGAFGQRFVAQTEQGAEYPPPVGADMAGAINHLIKGRNVIGHG